VAKSSVSLRGLRTFCAAAKHESFSAAADDLYITPSAVSHQIRRLEEELDQRLFDRGARELRLTGVGQSLYAEVSPLVEQINSIVGSYKKSVVRQSLRMSVQPFFASEFFMPRLAEFTAANPDIDIQVSASDESAESLPADADLSIRLFRAPPKGVESRLLFPLRVVPAGSKALAKSLRVKNGRISGEFPLIVHESHPKAWKKWGKKAGIAWSEGGKVTRLDSMIAIVRAAEQGIGAALVPIPLADQWFRQGTITRLFDDELVMDVSYFLIWQQQAEANERVMKLRDWILERFADAA